MSVSFGNQQAEKESLYSSQNPLLESALEGWNLRFLRQATYTPLFLQHSTLMAWMQMHESTLKTHEYHHFPTHDIQVQHFQHLYKPVQTSWDS